MHPEVPAASRGVGVVVSSGGVVRVCRVRYVWCLDSITAVDHGGGDGGSPLINGTPQRTPGKHEERPFTALPASDPFAVSSAINISSCSIASAAGQ